MTIRINMTEKEIEARRSEGKVILAKDRMLEKYPLHAAALGNMVLTCSPGVKTMGVTFGGEGRILLLHNPSFVLDLPMDQLVGVLLHEIHHVLFRHLLMEPASYSNKAALVIAQEVTVNEFVNEPLPEGVVLLKDYPDLPPLESTEQRYKRLEKAIPYTKVVISLDDHGCWQVEGEGLSEEEKQDILQGFIEHAIEEAGSSGALEEVLQQHGTETGYGIEGVDRGTGTINWQQALRHYIGQALEVRPVFHRPNRRFPELLGIVPGSTRYASAPKIMAVLDTSGSITARLLRQIDGELDRLARYYEVEVVECDTEVKRCYRYHRLDHVWGRGGTDLRPPLEEKFLREHKPDLVVYFTDGYGPTHDHPPSVPVVWVILSGGSRPCNWGHFIHCAEA